MRKLAMLAAMACTCLLAGPDTLDGGQPLNLQVSPTTAMSPAFVRVRAAVEASDDNRWLEIVAQSPEFFRSSRVDLDGRNAPRLAVFEYPGLPPGMYEIRAILGGTAGKRASEVRRVNVVPSAGWGR